MGWLDKHYRYLMLGAMALELAMLAWISWFAARPATPSCCSSAACSAQRMHE